MTTFTLLHGDCLTEMAAMDAGSVDAVCCDPPYGLEFMGKEWDWLGTGRKDNPFDPKGPKFTAGGSIPLPPTPHYGRKRMPKCAVCGGWKYNASKASECHCESPEFVTDTWTYPARMQDWHQAWATEALRVLKPSHYLLAFGGTRTWHRLACAIEDAGFEIRDTLMWLYGSGFPKSKSCLKPAWEPIILARKPGPMRELGIEECRVGTSDSLNGGAHSQNGNRVDLPGADRSGAAAGMFAAGKTVGTDFVQPSGRYPANLILDEEAGAMLDGQTGTLTSGSRAAGVRKGLGYHGGSTGDDSPVTVGDSGGASRFFYCAKASRSERNAGCEGTAEKALRLRSDITPEQADHVMERLREAGVQVA